MIGTLLHNFVCVVYDMYSDVRNSGLCIGRTLTLEHENKTYRNVDVLFVAGSEHEKWNTRVQAHICSRQHRTSFDLPSLPSPGRYGCSSVFSRTHGLFIVGGKSSVDRRDLDHVHNLRLRNS